MAFYTPPSLPRTPFDFAAAMAATTSLPWSLCKQLSPLTPPMSSTFQSRRTTTTTRPVPQQQQLSLPPIAYLDRQLAARAPLTPPEDVFPPPPPPQKQSPPHQRRPSPRIPKFTSKGEPVQQEFAPPKNSGPYTDWLDISRTRPAHFLAEKTCEMICYLWFATSSPHQSYPSPNNSPPFSQRPNPATTTLQLVATPTFVQFMQKLLETTQVSQSVIVLSLHYIYRLKDRNRFTPAQAGSEFRIAVAGLMMANKFLDDNTYTNKTWSEVSGIDLVEINRMEREFLMGVDFNLYVDKPTYESWLNLLKGLVLAKERDSRHFRKSRGLVRSSKITNSHPSSSGPVSRTYNTSSKFRTHLNRARSTSPSQSTTPYYSYPTFSSSHDLPPPPPPIHPAIPEPISPTPLRSGSKRSAAAAFSPTTATFSQIPTKRAPPVAITLQIPEFNSNNSGPHSHSPLEGLQSFATMSLASPHSRQPTSSQTTTSSSSQWVQQQGPRQVPETLVTPYPVNDGRRTAVPQNLYFYTLACSPMDREEESRSRKGKLRYHQPTPSSSSSSAAAPCSSSVPSGYYHHLHLPHPAAPPLIQSASTSPHDHHMHVTSSYTLPHFHDTQWSSSSIPARHFSNHTFDNSLSSCTTLPPITAPSSSSTSTAPTTATTTTSGTLTPTMPTGARRYESPVQSATFANAGPPGVHFYPTPVQQPSVYPPPSWSRGRRF